MSDNEPQHASAIHKNLIEWIKIVHGLSHSKSLPSLCLEDEYGPFDKTAVPFAPVTKVSSSVANFAQEYYDSPVEKNHVDEFESPALQRFKPLQHFFHGQLDPADIAAVSHLALEEGCFESSFEVETVNVGFPPETKILVLWQYGNTYKVNSVNYHPPLISLPLRDLIPNRFKLSRVAVIAYTDKKVHVYMVHLLNGRVSDDDPIHEIIRNDREQ